MWTVDVRRRRGPVLPRYNRRGIPRCKCCLYGSFPLCSSCISHITPTPASPPSSLRSLRQRVSQRLWSRRSRANVFLRAHVRAIPFLFWGKQVFPFHLSSKTRRAGVLREKRRRESGAERRGAERRGAERSGVERSRSAWSGAERQQQAEGTEDDSAFK